MGKMRRSAIRSAALVTAGTVVGALALTGCGPVDARAQAEAAAANLRAAHAVTFTVRVDDPNRHLPGLLTNGTSGADLRDAAKAAAALDAGTLIVTIDPPGNQTLGSLAKSGAEEAKQWAASGAMAVAYQVNGKDAVAIRQIGGQVYLRVDPVAFQAVTGQDLSGLAQAAQAQTSGPFGPVAQALEQGKWLSLDVKAVANQAKASGLLDQARAAAQDKAVVSGGDTAAQQAALQALAAQVLQAVHAHTATEYRNGSGTVVNVEATVDVKGILTAVAAALGSPQVKALTNGPQDSDVAGLRRAAAALPNVPVHATLVVKDRHLTGASIPLSDLAGLANTPGGASTPARLVMTVNDTTAAVTAPAASDTYSVTSLVQFLLGAVAGDMGGAPGQEPQAPASPAPLAG